MEWERDVDLSMIYFSFIHNLLRFHYINFLPISDFDNLSHFYLTIICDIRSLAVPANSGKTRRPGAKGTRQEQHGQELSIPKRTLLITKRHAFHTRLTLFGKCHHPARVPSRKITKFERNRPEKPCSNKMATSSDGTRLKNRFKWWKFYLQADYYKNLNVAKCT